MVESVACDQNPVVYAMLSADSELVECHEGRGKASQYRMFEREEAGQHLTLEVEALAGDNEIVLANMVLIIKLANLPKGFSNQDYNIFIRL